MQNRYRLSLALIAACVVSSVQAESLTLEDIVQLRTVVSVQIAPAGDQVAYILSVPRVPYVDDDGGPYRELRVVDLDGKDRGFVTGELSVRDVAWSGDGAKLYYLAERDDDDSISLYEIAIDGGESRKLFEHDTNMQHPRVSPDGRYIAFRAIEARADSYESLSDKGFRAVVYEEDVRFSELWLIDLEQDKLAARHIELPGHLSDFEWAPDSVQLVVALAPTPLVDDSYVRRSLHVISIETGEIAAEIEHEGKLGNFAWSPDSSRIAFIGAADANDPLEGRVYLVDSDGQNLTNLTLDYPGHVHQIAWRDRDSLYYSGSRGVWREFAILNADGSSAFPSLQAGDPIIRSYSSRIGLDAIAMIADTPEHPNEVYVWQPQSGYKRLTNSNPVLGTVDLAPQETLRFAARDGLEIEGILVRPIEQRRGRRYPVIIAVHGGPESHYSNGWMSGYTFPAQTLAADGYAVFYPNYRASTGRGVEFSKLDHNDPAGAEFDDLVDAKNHLVEIGLADPDRVGISGGSYGGYATMWGASALTEHFAAGVAFVGISDLIGSMGTSDIPNELNEVHLRAWPWEDWQFALERSPIYHVGQSKTPLLILGGDADPRVDHSQSMAMYRNMKLRTDTPVRLVQYPGEGHGNARVAARIDYSMRMKRWMDHYLKGPGGAPPPFELNHAERLESAD